MTIVLITGSARGLGREVARDMAARGHDVIISARDPAAAARTAAELGDGVRALPVGLDIADPASVKAVAARLDALDVLINNAAADVDWSETASGADLDGTQGVLEINLFGAWRLTQALLPLLRSSAAGRVVNVSSTAGSHGDTEFGQAARGG